MFLTFLLLLQIFKSYYSIYGEFSRDLSSISVIFDKNTNKGLTNKQFQCSELLLFDHSEIANCIWINNYNLIIYPGYYGTITYNNIIYIIPDTIKYCNNIICDEYTSIGAEFFELKMTSYIVSPTIILSLPSSITRCTDLNIDITQSTGSGGRPWNDIIVEVYKNDFLQNELVNYINNNIHILTQSTLSIPSNYFSYGTYSFYIILCNFINSCSSSSKNIVIVDTNSSISINLGNNILITRNQPLKIASELTIVDCNENSYIQPFYNWTLYELSYNKIVTNYKSISKLFYNYQLYPNTLKSNTVYLLNLNVTRGLVVSSSYITITVKQGNLVSLINGGLVQTIRKGEIKIVDASGSYDEDNDNTNGGLLYNWNCFQTQGDLCNYFVSLNQISYSTNSIQLFTNTLFNNNTIITLTISNSIGLKDVTNIIINTISNETPVINIDYELSSSFENVNINQPFQIYSYIKHILPISNVLWGSNVSNIELTNNIFLLNEANTYIQLIILPYTLPSRSFISFTLRIEDASATINIYTNGPPIPGIVTIKPKYGIELTDLFYFNALYWTDENMPLTYTYGQIEEHGFIYLQSSYRNSYNTILSIGNNHNITCFIIIEDSYGVSANQTDFVILTQLSNNEAENIIVTNLQQNILELNSMDVQKTVSLGTNIINRYSCTNTNNCDNKKIIRNSLVSGVNNIIQLNDVDNKNIYSSVYLLNELSSNIYELTNNTAHNIINTIEILLQNSQQNSINYNSIFSVLNSVDTSLSLLTSNNETNITQIFNIFENYNAIALNYKTPTTIINKTQIQNEIYNYFRISSGSFFYEKNIEIIYPQTQDELFNDIKSSISINAINNISVIQTSLIVPNNSFFKTNKSNWVTQPVFIQTSETGLFTFKLYNNKNFSSNDVLLVDTNCNYNSYEQYNFTCPDGSILNHKCNGTAGIISSECPSLKSVCHLFDFKTQDFFVSDYCTTITKDNYIICECDFQTLDSRKLTDLNDNKNSIMVVTIATYVASNIQNTFKQTEQLNINSFNDARVVLGIFLTIWGTGLILIASYYMKTKYYNNSKIYIDINKKIKSANNSKSIGFIRSNLIEYMDNILPHIFLKDKSYMYNILNELKRNHFYFKLVELWKNRDNKYFFYTHLFNILTVLTMFVFFVCLLYDIQCQTDDNSCSKYITQDSCLNKKSLLDNTQTYCKWNTDNTCAYQEQIVSLPTMVLIGFLVSIFSEIVSKPVDYLFDIIKSPSINIVNNLTEQETKMSLKETRINSLKLINDFRLSNASSKSIVANFNLSKKSTQKSIFIDIGNNDGYILNDPEENIEVYCDQFIKTNETINPETTKTNQDDNSNYNTNVKINEKLLNLINRQRLLLNREEQNEYDENWGINPVGELMNHSGIITEINNVFYKSNEITTYLKNSTNYDRGVEIIYLFILDLLGRKTPEAKIFDKKFNEEHQRYSVVTNTSKRRSIVLIVCLNTFFIYYTFLHALLKGINWQNQFLYSSLVQLTIEIFLFETIECVYINIIIPSFVKKSVSKAYEIMFELIDAACILNIENVEHCINVPNLLFVSTNVATHYPILIESVLVKLYNTYLPGKLSVLWNNNKQFNNLYNKKEVYYYFTCVSVVLVSSFVFFMQFISTIPFMFQRVIIKFIQPVLLLCLITIYNEIIKNIYLSICLSLFLSALTGRTLYIYSKKRSITQTIV